MEPEWEGRLLLVVTPPMERSGTALPCRHSNEQVIDGRPLQGRECGLLRDVPFWDLSCLVGKDLSGLRSFA